MSEFWWWHAEKGGVSRRVEACLNLPKERYAMTSDSTVVPLRQPEATEDPLTAVLRSGARRLLAAAVEAEAEAFLARIMRRFVLARSKAREMAEPRSLLQKTPQNWRPQCC